MAEMVNGRFDVDASFPHPARATTRTSASGANALGKMVMRLSSLRANVIEFIEAARSSAPKKFLGGVARGRHGPRRVGREPTRWGQARRGGRPRAGSVGNRAERCV